METELSAGTEDVAEAESGQNVLSEMASEEQSGVEGEERREQETLEEQRRCAEAAEEEDVADTADVEVPDARVNVEVEETTERDVEESVLLSEKERQNEEVNEKDNCSASSISSTSSTLEREEREEKFTSDSETGTGEGQFYSLNSIIQHSPER